MAWYIDGNALYEQTAEWEARALKHVNELNSKPLDEMTVEELEEWRKWSYILHERSAFKNDVAEAEPRWIPCEEQLPRWIPCEEQLPEAGTRYQVTFESGEVGYADFRNKIFLWDGSAKEKENVWETERYYEDDGEVIAWMPLPKPYRKETEDGCCIQ